VKKIRLIAIGSALATCGVVVTLLPSAQAAGKTPEEIVERCDYFSTVKGDAAKNADSDSDTCFFEETKFEVFDGPTEKVTVDFPHCEPNATEPATIRAEWSKSIGQGKGKYVGRVNGTGGGILGILSGAWTKHHGTFDLTLETLTASEAEERQVPPGKVLHVEFTPKMQRMTGVWKLRIGAKKANRRTPARPEENYETEDVVEGPVVLPGPAGAPGQVEGVSRAVLTDC
jgi:hypothetical protein